MKNALHTNIKFDDLTFEKQEEIIAILVEKLTEAAKTEGEEFLKRDWHDPKPKTWQEAYCRIYTIQRHNWYGYEKGIDKAEIPPFMWEAWQEESIKDKAEDLARQSLIKTEVELTI